MTKWEDTWVNIRIKNRLDSLDKVWMNEIENIIREEYTEVASQFVPIFSMMFDFDFSKETRFTKSIFNRLLDICHDITEEEIKQFYKWNWFTYTKGK